MEPDRKEALRYLGYGVHEPDERTLELLLICEKELEAAGEPRSLVREFPLSILPDGTIDGCCFAAKSAKLRRNLAGCGRILVMAATLGSGVDRLLARYGKLSMAKALVLQAASAAAIEAYCNRLCAGWREEYEKKGLYLRPRFSPGYGDFPLSCQRGILDGLEAGKRLGITLTESLLMLPSKSVTAVIGLSENQNFCRIEGCEICEKTDCAYRR